MEWVSPAEMVFQAASTGSAKAPRQEGAQQCSENRKASVAGADRMRRKTPWKGVAEVGGGRSGGPCGPWEGIWLLSNIETYTANRRSFPSGLNFFIIFQGRRSLFSKEGLHGTRRVQIGVGCLPPAFGGAERVLQDSCRSGVKRGLNTPLLPPPPAYYSHLQETETQRADVTFSRSHSYSQSIQE